MSKSNLAANVKVTIHGKAVSYNVKSLAMAKRVKRLIDAMQLPGVGLTSVGLVPQRELAVSDILQAVFAASTVIPDPDDAKSVTEKKDSK